MTKLELLSQVYQREGIHLRELSRVLKVGLPTVEHHIRKLEQEKLIKKVKEGKNVKIFLNLKNTGLIPYLYNVEHSRISTFPDKVSSAIFDFLRLLSIKPVLTIIFGSYAKGTFTDESDIDLFMVFNKLDKEDIEEIENKSKAVRYKYSIEIAPVYVTLDEFNQKFFDEKDKFMRELKQNKIIIQGIEWWVLIENEK